MSHPSRNPRQPANLPASTCQRLNMYAFAASAAGISLLALSQTAEGEIVYTPAHRVIPPHHSYNIDLNHDGITDFKIANSVSACTDFCFFELRQWPTDGNRAVGYFVGSGTHYPANSALRAGVTIGPRSPFKKGTAEMAVARSNVYTSNKTIAYGPWVNVKDRYLGIKFQIKGNTHYGWVRLNVEFRKTTITATFESATPTRAFRISPSSQAKQQGRTMPALKNRMHLSTRRLRDAPHWAYSRWGRPGCRSGDGKSQRALPGKDPKQPLVTMPSSRFREGCAPKTVPALKSFPTARQSGDGRSFVKCRGPKALRVRNLPNCSVRKIASTEDSSPVEVALRVQADPTQRPVAIRSVVVEVVQIGVEEAPRGQLEHRAVVVDPAKRCSPIDVARGINRHIPGLVEWGASVRAVKREDRLEFVLTAGTLEFVYRPMPIFSAAFRRAVKVFRRIQDDSGSNLATVRFALKTVKDLFLISAPFRSIGSNTLR